MRRIPTTWLPVASLVLMFCHNTIPVNELAHNLGSLSVEEIRDRMELYIEEKAGSKEIPGAAAALFRQGTPILWVHKGLDDDQKVSIASLTKPFTSMIILRLSRSGRLDLDESITEYFPELKAQIEKSKVGPEKKQTGFSAEALDSVTVRMLLSHRSGIGYEMPSNKREQFSIENKSFPLPQTQKQGKFEYSNFNYHILALLARKITGKPVGSLVQQWILKPAGMKDTDASQSSGAAGMVSTLEDLTRFCDFILRENDREDSPYYRVFEAFADDDSGKPRDSYGLGWHVFAPSGRPALFYHSGTWYNAAAEIYILPNEHSYFVHIANPPNFRDKETIRYRSDVLTMGRIALTRPN